MKFRVLERATCGCKYVSYALFDEWPVWCWAHTLMMEISRKMDQSESGWEGEDPKYNWWGGL